MSFREQKKYLEALKRYERKFEKKELEDYKMLVKRHKDEEDLDKLSLGRLEKMYEKYYLNRQKRNFDDIFKNTEQTEEKTNEE